MDSSGPESRGTAGTSRRRTFSAQSFREGSWWFLRNLPRLVRASRSDRVGDQFREKILLTVTAANECRYCVRVHTSVASAVGIDDETIDRLLETDVEGAVLEFEKPALRFALHYAETDGDPDPALLAAVEDAYDPATVADIVAFTRAMHLANLLGNTVDAAGSLLDQRLEGGLGHARERCSLRSDGDVGLDPEETW